MTTKQGKNKFKVSKETLKRISKEVREAWSVYTMEAVNGEAHPAFDDVIGPKIEKILEEEL